MTQFKKGNHYSWKKGQSGNPKGRLPKGYSITEMFQQMFNTDPDKKRQLMEAVFKKALEGDIAAQKLVWNYMDGMPAQSTDITSNGETILPTSKILDKIKEIYG